MVHLPLLLAGCLFDDTGFKLRVEALTDHDGDGVVLEDDCDDTDGRVHPGALEVCDGADQDCDGEVDEEALDADDWYRDADDDGYGDETAVTRACQRPNGSVADAGDCDDNDAGVHPGGTETCDGADQDCDGATDEDAQDATEWYGDADGDGYGEPTRTTSSCERPTGYSAADDDCDDDDPTVYPGADDAWYDGVDSNCDGADDFDADADGDPWEGAGGTDCNDEDASVSGVASEGWWDAGTDNNCDGSIEDQASAPLDALGVEVIGSAAGGQLGTALVALPAGWLDDGPVLLAGAPGTANGEIAGWTAVGLTHGPTVASATWQLAGAETGESFGIGMGWLGAPSEPIVAIGATTAGGDLGAAYLWTGGNLEGPPDVTVTGASHGQYLGYQIVSGHDHDGDGVADLLVTAPNDSHVASNAGAAFIYLAPGELTSDLTSEDADIEFDASRAGANLAVADIGDADGDGLDDLGFTQNLAYGSGPGGLLVSSGAGGGVSFVEDCSFAQVEGGPFTFGQVWDPDGDGVRTLLATSGGVHAFTLPVSGTITPWGNAAASLEFDPMGPSVRAILTTPDTWADHTGFLVTSPGYDGSAGLIGVERFPWPEGSTVEDATFLGLGALAGDASGYATSMIDWNGDGTEDIAAGAPGRDRGGDGAGSIFLIPGPS